jgi:hypothetical protein
MDTMQDEYDVPLTVAGRRDRWLPVLEQELKRRIGWADEAVSPFARQHRRNADPDIRRAA